MLSFLGSYEHSFDGKGRVVLPVAFRDEFADGGVAMARKGHLALYPAEAWSGTLEKFRVLLAEGRLTRQQFNQLLSLAAEVKPDGQGRITIPGRIRLAGAIDGDKVVISGVDNYLAINPGENVADDAVEVQNTLALVDGMGV